MKIVICAILRTENRYLPGWIDYHLSLGFDHIYLYDNAYVGEEHVEDVIDVTGKYLNKVSVFPIYNKFGMQVPAYTEFYKKYSLFFDYVVFIDLDEYIFIDKRKYNSIGDFIISLEYPDAVSLNWRIYGDNDYVDDDGRFDCDRFLKPLPTFFSKDNVWGKQSMNWHVKTIYKSNLNIDAIFPHCSNGNYYLVNSLGMPLEKNALQKKIVYENCYVKHFITRTISEFIKTKVSRGCRVDGMTGSYSLSGFFCFNKPTFGKLKIYSETIKHFEISSTPSIKWWVKIWIKMWIITPILRLVKD